MTKKPTSNQDREIEYIGQATAMTLFIKKNGIVGLLCLWVIGLQIQIYFTRQDLHDCYLTRSFHAAAISPSKSQDVQDSPPTLAVLPAPIRIKQIAADR